jgi:hypothetical protein
MKIGETVWAIVDEGGLVLRQEDNRAKAELRLADYRAMYKSEMMRCVMATARVARCKLVEVEEHP